jgi:hypothetical protein
MAANYPRDIAAASGSPIALLLHPEAESPEQQSFAKLLDCLGVPWQSVTIGDLQNAPDSGVPYCVISPANPLTAFFEETTNSTSELPRWMKHAASVYVYGFGEDSTSERLLRRLTGNNRARVRRSDAREVSIEVSNELREMCGPMCGLRFEGHAEDDLTLFDIPEHSAGIESVLTTDQGQLLVMVKRDGARLFLSATPKVVDVSAPRTQYLDVRERFADTLPIVLYARDAFGVGSTPEISAALIVDDPPLKPRYGFLKYQRIVGLMDKHNFATTIAFIPWNWKRTERETVQLFHNRPDRLSLCVHGCDHTGKEFAERSDAVLNKRVKVANERMELFRRRTRLQHHQVMLFPQGAFSASAALALKVNGFAAVVNTEVTPVHRDENKTTVGDLLGMAIMKYASLPMFTRRYLAHGVENFAFDGLLGKPCFIAAHHDDFAADGRILLQVIDQLNALNWNLRWRALGDGVRRSFSVRKQKDGHRCIEMYGTNLIYTNSPPSANGTAFLKEESDFDRIKSVVVNGEPIDHLYQRGYLRFEATVAANQSAQVQITYNGGEDLPARDDGVKYRAKALVRRYLSEFRDNYLSQNIHLLQRAVRIKEALRL